MIEESEDHALLKEQHSQEIEHDNRALPAWLFREGQRISVEMVSGILERHKHGALSKRALSDDFARFESVWLRQLLCEQPRLLSALLEWVSAPSIVSVAWLLLVSHLLQLVVALAYMALVNTLYYRRPFSELALCALALTVPLLLLCYVYHCFSLRCCVIGLRVQNALRKAVFSKSVRLPSGMDGSAEHTKRLCFGQLAELPTVVQLLPVLVLSPLAFLASLTALCVILYHWRPFDYSGEPGASSFSVTYLFPLLCLVPITPLLTVARSLNTALHSEEQPPWLRSMQGLLSGLVHNLKQCRLHDIQRVLLDRAYGAAEGWLSRLNRVKAANSAAPRCLALFFVAFLVLAHWIDTHIPLTIQLFCIGATVSLFRWLVFVLCPKAFQMTESAGTAIQSIEEFLLRPEMPSELHYRSLADCRSQCRIIIRDGHFRWRERPELRTKEHSDSEHTGDLAELLREREWVLRGIHLDLGHGQLVSVCGRSHSGKTSLLSAILGELPPSQCEGCELVCPGPVGLVPSDPWIFEGSLKENITLQSQSLNEEEQWYQSVLDACCLRNDLEAMPNGDQTRVTRDRLSGGQAARVCLARALFQKPKLLLLDSPFAPLDSRVSRSIFTRLFAKEHGLCRSEDYSPLILLVTDQLKFIQQTDLVIALKLGKQTTLLPSEIEGCLSDGDFHEFGIDKGGLHSVIDEDNNEDDKEGPTMKPLKNSDQIQDSAVVSHANVPSFPWRMHFQFLLGTEQDIGASQLLTLVLVVCVPPFLVFLSDLFLFSDSAGIPKAPTLAVILLISIVVAFLLNLSMLRRHQRYTLALVRGLAESVCAAELSAVRKCRSIPEYLSLLCGARYRILRELSSDDLYEWLIIMGQHVSILLAGLVLNPSLVLCHCLSIALISRPFRDYWRASDKLDSLREQLESKAQSTIQDCINGLPSVRAFLQTAHFEEDFRERCDLLTQVSVVRQWSLQQYSVYIDLVCSLNSLLITLVVIVVPSGWLSLRLSLMLVDYAILQVTRQSYSTVRLIEFESNLRIVHEIRTVTHFLREHAEPEQSGVSPILKRGAIQFRNVDASYDRDSNTPDLVLKGLHFEIEPGQTIGVCGRTGAGKSSLLACLAGFCRIVRGQLFFGDCDLSELRSVHSLRQCVIPFSQRLLLFPDHSLRFNLSFDDDLVSDVDIWHTLSVVKLRTLVESLPGQLDAPLSRLPSVSCVFTLVALGRAVLLSQRRPKAILLIDELNSSVDSSTRKTVDEILSRCLLSKHTSLVVCHRVDSLLTCCDRILVLERGRLVEMDTPARLTSDPLSHLSRLRS